MSRLHTMNRTFGALLMALLALAGCQPKDAPVEAAGDEAAGEEPAVEEPAAEAEAPVEETPSEDPDAEGEGSEASTDGDDPESPEEGAEEGEFRMDESELLALIDGLAQEGDLRVIITVTDEAARDRLVAELTGLGATQAEPMKTRPRLFVTATAEQLRQAVGAGVIVRIEEDTPVPAY